MTTTAVTDEQVNAFVEWLQSMMDRTYGESSARPTIVIHPGTRNIKVVRNHKSGQPESVYCFIEKESGKVMKPAGWSAPEPKRYERANIHDPSSWEKGCGPYGVEYRR